MEASCKRLFKGACAMERIALLTREDNPLPDLSA
jgi:hypothetical protein